MLSAGKIQVARKYQPELPVDSELHQALSTAAQRSHSCELTGLKANHRRSASLFQPRWQEGAKKCWSTVRPPLSPVKVSCDSVGEVGEGGAFNSRNATPSHGQHGDVQSSRARSRAPVVISAQHRQVGVTSLSWRHWEEDREVVADWPNGGPIPILSARTQSDRRFNLSHSKLDGFATSPVSPLFIYLFLIIIIIIRLQPGNRFRGSNREDKCWNTFSLFIFFGKMPLFVLPKHVVFHCSILSADRIRSYPEPNEIMLKWRVDVGRCTKCLEYHEWLMIIMFRAVRFLKKRRSSFLLYCSGPGFINLSWTI